jgi:ubiquinone/menaquinone biosynthesis C-methylase UbiE
MLAFAGLPRAALVLDAGCGSGSFLSALRDAGASKVLALDPAAEHLVAIAHGAPASYSLPVRAIVHSIPLAPASIDAVWCANTLQFLDDSELRSALAEFLRVVRPGGIVAIKDVDMTAFKVAPASPFLGSHLAEACVSGEKVAKESHGSLRGRDFRVLMQEAGFENVVQRTFPIERWGPLTGFDAAFWRDWLPYLAALAEARGVPESDLQTWKQVSTPVLAEIFITRPDFYGCELQVVCSGRRA